MSFSLPSLFMFFLFLISIQASSSINGIDKVKFTDSPFSFQPLPLNAVPNSTYSEKFISANKNVFFNLYNTKKNILIFDNVVPIFKNEKEMINENENGLEKFEIDNKQKKTKNSSKSVANISEADKSVADLCDIVKTAVTDYNR